MILEARHHFLIYPFFRHYAVWKVKRHFRPIRVVGEVSVKELPLLLVANHVSWWDGFWAMYLNMTLFRKKFHFMMLESQLRKFWFFNHTGGFSVKRGSRSVLETLGYAAGLLTDKRNLVLVFPEGEIRSMHSGNVRFEKGLERITRSVEGEVQLLFMVSLVDYFSSPVPGLWLYLEEYEGPSGSLAALEERFNSFYRRCLEQQRQIKSTT